VLTHRLDADDAEPLRAAVAAVADGGGLDLEVRVPTPDGATRWYHLLGEVERDESGAPRRLRGSTQDVTERRAAAAAFVAAAAEREARAREQRIADELQHSLLPEPRFVPDALEVATYYQAGVAGTQVGGDWYDVIDVGADRTALVIGDVMGRGVRAAAVMGQMRTAVRAFAQLDLPPADVLEQLDAIVRELEPVQLVTCIYGIYDPHARTFTYANAGHLPPLVKAPGEPARRFSGAANPPLGAGPVNRGEREIELPPQARLVLYTDGLVERRDRPLDDGIDGLAAALERHDGPLEALPGGLVAAVAPAGAEDDMAVLAAEVGGPAVEATASFAVEADINAAARARAFAAATLRDWSLPEPLARDVLLVVSELVSNAVKYGRPPVEIRLRHDRRHLLVEVEDRATAIPRKLRPSPFQEHGRGLQLVARVTDRWGTRPTPGGKVVWCSLSLARYIRR
jgi:serine phosphatase RsbU (regulator of sigma subunit)/anti-sigma regulatory factor (Ser/Thr protein kinase)